MPGLKSHLKMLEKIVDLKKNERFSELYAKRYVCKFQSYFKATFNIVHYI